MLRKALYSLSALVALSAAPVLAGGEGWTHDMQAAMKQAAEEKKDLLLDFTGSDWCGWCIKLNEEVFSQEPFKSVKDDFVLVELDFPRDKSKLTPETIKQNEQWRDKLGVRGYPSIFLCTADGEPYAKTGYQAGGAEKYVAHLTELREAKAKLDKVLAGLNDVQGEAKARMIDEALTAAEAGLILKNQDELIQEVIKLDPENKLGLGNKYQVKAAEGEIDELAGARKFKEAADLIDSMIKKYDVQGEQAQDLYFKKVICLYRVQDKEGAMAALDAAIAAAPESARVEELKQIKQQLSGQ